MITIISYDIDGKKIHVEVNKTIERKELEVYRNEIAMEHKVNKKYVVFQIMEK